MGLRGPLPEPLDRKKLKGTLRPDRERKRARASDAPAADAPVMPAWVARDRDARGAWVLALAAGHWLTPADVPALEAFCGAVAQLRRGERALARTGDMAKTPYGPKPSPYLRLVRDARNQVALLAKVLRLDPGSRLRNPKPPAEDAEANDFARLFGRGLGRGADPARAARRERFFNRPPA